MSSHARDPRRIINAKKAATALLRDLHSQDEERATAAAERFLQLRAYQDATAEHVLADAAIDGRITRRLALTVLAVEAGHVDWDAFVAAANSAEEAPSSPAAAANGATAPSLPAFEVLRRVTPDLTVGKIEALLAVAFDEKRLPPLGQLTRPAAEQAIVETALRYGTWGIEEKAWGGVSGDAEQVGEAAAAEFFPEVAPSTHWNPDACPDCDGEGSWFDASHSANRVCRTCKGSGKRAKPGRTLTIRTEDGAAIQYDIGGDTWSREPAPSVWSYADGTQHYLCPAHTKRRTDAGEVLGIPIVDNARFLATSTGREFKPRCEDCAAGVPTS